MFFQIERTPLQLQFIPNFIANRIDTGDVRMIEQNTDTLRRKAETSQTAIAKFPRRKRRTDGAQIVDDLEMVEIGEGQNLPDQHSIRTVRQLEILLDLLIKYIGTFFVERGPPEICFISSTRFSSSVSKA